MYIKSRLRKTYILFILFEENKMKYINNNNGSSLAQGVLKRPR